MKVNSRIAVLLAAGSFSLAAMALPASAASVISEAFLANVQPNIDFLQRSSRLALDHSSNRGIRAYAASEVAEQDIAEGEMTAWIRTSTLRGTIGTVDVAGAVVPSPVDVAEVPVAATTDVVTGRSVAIEAPVAINTAPEAGHQLLPAGQNDLERLAARDGRSFDRLYRGTQRDALRQLSTLYAAYIENGDDPTLRAMAAEQLPKVNRRITEMHRL